MNVNDIQIRMAGNNDIEVLLQVRLLFLEDSFRSLIVVEEKMISKQLRRYYSQHLGNNFYAVLAFLADKVVSCAFLVVDEWPANLSVPMGRFGTILNVYTDPAWRGKGLATRVMEQLLSIARNEGISKINLKATELGIPLYKKFGFQEEGHEHVNMVLPMT